MTSSAAPVCRDQQLAHEIKQPLAAAITRANTGIEWLTHEPPNVDRARAAAARIDKYGNRATEIIDRMRSFYRKSLPLRELVDVNQIICEILALLKGQATRHSVTMRTELAVGLPKAMADCVQLQQVFVNLVLNAIEAMKDSGGELTVSRNYRTVNSSLRSVTPALGCQGRRWTRSFLRSLRPRRRPAGWVSH